MIASFGSRFPTLGAAVTALTLFAASQASAITYTFSSAFGSIGGGTVTTDGTLGTLTASNITDFSITFGDVPTVLTPPGSGVFLTDTGILTATATDLLFDFGTDGYLNFQLLPAGSGQFYFCFEGGGSGQTSVANCGGQGLVPGLIAREGAGSTRENIGQTGNAVIASVAPPPSEVPLPAGLVLLASALGVLGLRRRTA